ESPFSVRSVLAAVPPFSELPAASFGPHSDGQDTFEANFPARAVTHKPARPAGDALSIGDREYLVEK
ncbi:MAG: hypothetical protein PVG29_00400, partial [Gammaproteobacteria bacterium]